jgi:hypothetical protein
LELQFSLLNSRQLPDLRVVTKVAAEVIEVATVAVIAVGTRVVAILDLATQLEALVLSSTLKSLRLSSAVTSSSRDHALRVMPAFSLTDSTN